jgi:O-antigen/teichoic acid export membrane protein
VGIFLFIILFFSSNYISYLFNQPELASIIKVVGFIVVLNSLSSVSRSLLQKHFKFKQTSLITILTTVVGYIIGVILAYNDWGVWSLIAASLTNAFLLTIVLFYYAPIKISLRFHIQEMKELFSFGSGMILARSLSNFSSNGLNLVLGFIFQPAQLGLFERTNTIKSLPSKYLGNVLDTIMFPAMAEIQDEKERLFRVYQHGLGVVNTILMPISLYLIIFSEEIVLILLGNQWLDAVIPLQIMFIVLPFSSSVRMADSVIRAKGLIFKNVARRSIYLVILLATASIGAYFYGIIGAAAAVTFSYICNYTLMLFLVKSIFNKGLKEIFMKPIWAGLKLSIVMLIIIVFYILIFNGWQFDSILKYFIISVLVGFSLLIVIWKRPTIMGDYLQDTVLRIFKKN